MVHARDGERGGLGPGEDLRLDAVHEVGDHVGGDLVAGVRDEEGHDEARHAVRPSQPQSHPDEPRQRSGRGQGVEPGVLGVGEQGARVDLTAHPALVPSDDLIADDPHGGGGHAQVEMRRLPVARELADAHHRGGDGARPHGDGHHNTGKVLGALVAVGVGAGRTALGEPEADEHRGRGRDVREVVERIAQERDRSPQDRDRQLEHAGEAQADRRDGDGAVGGRPLRLVVGRDRRERIPLHVAVGKQVHDDPPRPLHHQSPPVVPVRARCERFVAAGRSDRRTGPTHRTGAPDRR